jgi:hypothetical protein
MITRSIQEYAIGELSNPAFSPTYLLRRFGNRSPVPSLPIDFRAASISVPAGFVGEDDYVVFKDHKKVAEFLAIGGFTLSPLISEWVRIAPEV